MLGESYPLMLNHLLATVFWRIDVLILTPMAGVFGVGLYSAAYKYIDGLNVIPAYFTLAIFPVMSRFAADSPDTLCAHVQAGPATADDDGHPHRRVRLLLRPTSDPAPRRRRLHSRRGPARCKILVISIPIGFINSVTHYVLIAVGQQRFLTRAFVFGVVFNTVGNLIFIPRYGAVAAAVITVLSEFSLLFPFYYAVRKHLAPLPWLDLLWRQVAGALMAAAFVLVGPFSLLLAIILAFAAYGLALVATGALKAQDMEAVWGALPLGRLRGLLGGTAPG